jgi:hypothetical protein
MRFSVPIIRQLVITSQYTRKRIDIVFRCILIHWNTIFQGASQVTTGPEQPLPFHTGLTNKFSISEHISKTGMDHLGTDSACTRTEVSAFHKGNGQATESCVPCDSGSGYPASNNQYVEVRILN